jgi:phage-related baseplate assembly protein
MTIQNAVLFVADTAANIYSAGIELAAAAGLPTTSWRTGDPTRSLYAYLARCLGGLEGSVANYIKAGWLSSAEGPWLQTLASEVFGVDFTQATYSEPTITVTNTKGGYFTPAPGSLTFKCSATGATFHNTDAGTDTTTNAPGPLSAGKTLRYALTADVAGSAGTVAINEIDTLVTTLLGVVVVSSTAAIGGDEQDDPSLRAQCLATLGALSPNGPADAYEFVARNPALTTANDVARARAIADAPTGAVLTYIAGVSGPVADASVGLVLAAIVEWATPLCITPTAAKATAIPINVSGTLTGAVQANFSAAAQAAIQAAFGAFDIANTDGDQVDDTLVSQAIRDAVPGIKVLTLASPAAPVALMQGQYPVLGTFTLTQA